ncbi:DUF6228 family protein [Kitasatospora herbaricolor]|uniref:DUF6228 family protein n=1 Tax=Kitasatospora herbaricolor TaxID=68217 RepID=UPI0036DE2935
MNAAVIGRGSRTLTFVCEGERSDALIVTLSDGGLRAVLKIEPGYIGFASLSTFFADLASSWRGWHGERVYESLEHDLEIRASHKGHVALDVGLRETTVDGWTARSTFWVEPAEELDRIAADVAGVLAD